MTIKRLLAAAFLLLLALPALAASIADRSPFAQGVWWNPARSGDGFQIFNAADQVAVTWYTYDDLSNPIWYTAQGDLASLGTQSWPLMKHRWANGRKADATQVGTLRLTVRHPEGMDLAWEIGGKQGTWAIQPFTFSGVINEVDHSGLWFDPANGGWGFSLTEQGDIMGGLLFTYDASGAPTWVAGFDRTPNTVQIHAYSGSCTSCPYRPPTTRNVGRLSFDFQSETRLTIFNEMTLPMAPGVNVGGAHLISLNRPASSRAADRQLASFHSSAALKAYLDAGMQQIPPAPAGSDFSAAPPAAVFSPTNLQESGVDEADLVKTDGRYAYTFTDSGYGRWPEVKVVQVGDNGSSLDVRARVSLASGASTPMSNAGLYLEGDRLVAVTGSQPSGYTSSFWTSIATWTRGATHIEVLSTANPALPATLWRAQIDGYIVSSRRIGKRLYVVSRYVPHVQNFIYGTTHPTSVTANAQLLAGTTLSEMLPKVRINGGEPGLLVAVSSIFAPPQGERRPVADMILVTAIDLEVPRIAQTLAIIGAIETVYASSTSLFVASSRYDVRSASGALLPIQPPFVLTDIHQLRLEPAGMDVVGSATVEGYLSGEADKLSFRLSEHQGRLRAVTSTSTNMWGGAHRSRLTILEPSARAPGLLKTISYIPNAQRPQTLGKPNELLYATRFVGDRLYAVTFRMVDPLYVVDLADAGDPKIAGALEVPGFSEYLHPLPNGLLLGFGKDATADGVYQGLQLSLYDVSDAGRPREMQRFLMGQRGSESALLRDHHAFSALQNDDGSLSIAFPARIYDGTPAYGGGASIVTWQQSGLMRFQLRGQDPSNAILAQLPSLVTHSAQSTSIYPDAAALGGRSLLFRGATIYVGGGFFWRMDNTGRVWGPY